MSATSSPHLWKQSDRKREAQTPARRYRMSPSEGPHDQLVSHSHLVQERKFDPVAEQFDPFPEINHPDTPFDHPTNESYSTAETVADSEDILRPSIEPTLFDFGPESNTTPFPNLEDGYILDMNFDPLDSFEYNAEEQNEKNVGLVPHHNPAFAGLASHENQLMSPQLTEIASPDSSFGGPTSPAERFRLLEGGSVSRISSQSTSIDRPASLCQHTPALTGCSVEASPEPGSGPNSLLKEKSSSILMAGFQPEEHTSGLGSKLGEGAMHASEINRPVVRIEKYSRGDSPARTEASGHHRVGKRSRSAHSTSHLAAPSEFSTLDDSEHDENVSEPLHAKRAGFDPTVRNQIFDTVPNFSDQAAKAHSEVIKGDVEDWLSNVSIADLSHNRPTNFRKRAQSTSDGFVQVLAGADAESISSKRLAEANAKIPGPGLYIQEDSDNDVEESASQDQHSISDAALASPVRIEHSDYNSLEDTVKDLTGSPWEDPINLPSLVSQGQPQTSQIAMTRFLRKAADVETASRKATWGTTVRRMSETDLERLLGPEGLLSRLSVGRDKIMEIVDRRGSMLASRLLPKRSPSAVKNRPSEGLNQDTEAATSGGPLEVLQSRKDSLHARKESYGDRPNLNSRINTESLRRKASNGKNKSSRTPRIHTGGAVAAIASQVAVIGANGSISPTATSSPTRGWSSARNMMRRRSRGESNRPANENSEPGLAALWTQQGGPPLPTLASPPQEKDTAAPFGPADTEPGLIKEELPVSIDFTPQSDGIIPTKEGFKINVQSVNPRILPFLAERLAREQLARYKKLVKLKIEHAEAVRSGNCPSGKYCPQLGGQPSYLPARSSKKGVELSHTGFSQTATSSAEDDCDGSSEGLVMATQFPDGVPMPPVTRLPAEFECPLCFTVKKIQKPSDWSKHVHEDLQPFTCTFADCNEPKPKSFKRKADWVRHENERHRQLEWWTCNKPDCQHKCYRRDNFVQHLVREHKLADPNTKPARSNKPAVRGPGKKTKANDGTDSTCDDEVLLMVTQCRSDTTSQPQSEVCRFCGNICNSWKKLTVHLAKHMEQISIPILELVQQREVSPDTIISPVEQQQSRAVSALRTQESDLMQDDLSAFTKTNSGFNPRFVTHSTTLSDETHSLYQGAQMLPSASNHMHTTNNLVPPTAFGVRDSIWTEPNQHSANQGSPSRIRLDQAGNNGFVQMYTSSEHVDQTGYAPVNMLPTSSAAFHSSTSYSNPISPITGGPPMSYMVNSGFSENPQPYQDQDLTFHPQYGQPQYRSPSNTPFQQPLNFDPPLSPQVQQFYSYST